MKKIVILFIVFAFAINSFGAYNLTVPDNNASDIFIPVGKTGKKISLLELSRISIADFETLSGRNMKRVDEVGFKMAQKKLKKGIRADGTIKNKKLNKFTGKITGSETGFHLGGFALGFLLGLVGVLLAYVVFEDDSKKNRIKWSWVGLGVSVILSIILIVAYINTYSTFG